MNGLEDESDIVWEADITNLDYVRETRVLTSRRRGRVKPPLKPPEGRLIGYANLRPDAKSVSPGMFFRRVFWVKSYDRSEQPAGVYAHGSPSEAVDPKLIAPTIEGERP